MNAQKELKKYNKELHNRDHFRVSIFGSARLEKDTELYKEIHDLAERLGKKEIGVVTGGGPGVMEAANEGHKQGDKDGKNPSIGLTIELPFEAEGNEYLDVQRHFMKFSNRLDNFMKLSDVIVVMPGGVGTCLELFYTWQLIQVGHVCKMPIILVGGMWNGLIDWVDENLNKTGLISPEDMKLVRIAESMEEVEGIIDEVHKEHKEDKDCRCDNVDKYV